jgi:hypothetical protein
MDASLIAVSKTNWPVFDAFSERNSLPRPSTLLWNTVHSQESPLSASMLGLSNAHIMISFAVRVNEASILLPFFHGSMIASPYGEAFILSATLESWEQILVKILRQAREYICSDTLVSSDTYMLACALWIILEANGFRDVFIKYEKYPLARGIFGI